LKTEWDERNPEPLCILPFRKLQHHEATKVIKGGGSNLTDDFIRFMEHYGFEAVFCNVNAGHEKGYIKRLYIN